MTKREQPKLVALKRAEVCNWRRRGKWPQEGLCTRGYKGRHFTLLPLCRGRICVRREYRGYLTRDIKEDFCTMLTIIYKGPLCTRGLCGAIIHNSRYTKEGSSISYQRGNYVQWVIHVHLLFTDGKREGHFTCSQTCSRGSTESFNHDLLCCASRGKIEGEEAQEGRPMAFEAAAAAVSAAPGQL